MKVYVVLGRNGFLSGLMIWVAATKEIANKIVEDNAYQLDDHSISEKEVQE